MNMNYLSSSPVHTVAIRVAGDLDKTPSHKSAFLQQAVSQQAAVWGKDPAGIALLCAASTQDNKTPSVQCLQQLDLVTPYVQPHLAGGERV